MSESKDLPENLDKYEHKFECAESYKIACQILDKMKRINELGKKGAVILSEDNELMKAECTISYEDDGSFMLLVDNIIYADCCGEFQEPEEDSLISINNLRIMQLTGKVGDL